MFLPGIGDVLGKSAGGKFIDGVGKRGVAYAQSNGSLERDLLNSDVGWIPTGGGFSILVVVEHGSSIGTGQGYGVGTTNFLTNNNRATLSIASNTAIFDYGGQTAGTTRVTGSTPTNDGKLSVLLGTTGPAGMLLYENGVLLGSNSSNPTRLSGSTYGFVVGDCYSGTSGNGKQFLIAAWTHQISHNLAIALSDNPWQIFKPRKRVFYSLPAFPVLSSLAVSNITSSGGRLTAST